MISAISLHANLDEWCAPLAPKRGSLTLRQTPVVECCVRSYHVLQLSAAMMSGLASTKGSAATRIAVPIMTILPARTHNRVMPLTDLQVYVTRGARYDARWMDATTTPTLPHAPRWLEFLEGPPRDKTTWRILVHARTPKRAIPGSVRDLW